MRYRVLWEGTCSDDIDEALDVGESARRLLPAIRAIEELLADDPYANGHELPEELRIIDVLPLRAYYYIEERDFVVKVTAVRLLPTK
jgi:hypothetical protein